MIGQQQTRYFYINPERASQILRDYQSFKRHYQEFQFEEPESNELRTTNALYQDIARGMGHVSKLEPAVPQGGMGTRGLLRGLIKMLLVKLVRPVIKLSFTQQQEMNRHTVLLAQAVVALEARVSMLEHQLKMTTNNPH